MHIDGLSCSLKILLFDHNVAINIPGYHEWNEEKSDEETDLKAESFVVDALGVVTVHAGAD